MVITDNCDVNYCTKMYFKPGYSKCFFIIINIFTIGKLRVRAWPRVEHDASHFYFVPFCMLSGAQYSVVQGRFSRSEIWVQVLGHPICLLHPAAGFTIAARLCWHCQQNDNGSLGKLW